MTKFICDLPWVHFSISPQGTTTVCCEAVHTESTGHGYNISDTNEKLLLSIKDNSISAIVNSDNYKSIRRDMIAGIVPAACVNCKKLEDAGGLSKRLKDSQWLENWEEKTAADGFIVPDIRSVELRLGNYCNLKCRSCNAESSTSWISDYNAIKDQVPLASDYDNIKSQSVYSFNWSDHDEFYDDLAQHIDNIDELHISGGEPFLVPKHFKLLELLFKRGKTDINIGYHTNLNYNIDKIKPALDILKDFKNVRFNCSIDDVGDRNRYIRNPSNWDLSIHNLLEFKNNYSNIFLIVCQTVNTYNFMYIEELHQFLNKNNIDVYHYYNHVHSPDYQTAYIIDPEVRKEKINQIQHLLPERQYNDLCGRYSNDIYKEDAKKLFLTFTNALDKRRNENWIQTFPKLHKVLI